MSSVERPSPRARLLVLLVLALALAVAVLYAQTARHEFVSYDDGSYLTENPRVAGGLTARNVRWAFTAFHSSNWHPLTWLSHQLDVELFGLAPGPHHLVGAGLHALNAALLLFFLARATGQLAPSFLVALLFAVHPQRVESVAWASERKDLLAGLFFCATLLAYERWTRAPSRARYAAIVVALALGLLAKPMLVSLPLVLLALDLWPLGRVGRVPLARLLAEKLPLVALCVASAAVTLLAQSRGGAVQPVEALGLPARFATAVLGTTTYLVKLVWPTGLAFFYPHPAVVAPETFEPFGPRVLLGALVLALVTAAAVGLRRRAPWFLAGWAWMGVMLLPVIGIVQVGEQLCADRYVYLPMVGALLVLVFGLEASVRAARARQALYALGLVAAGLLAWRAEVQVGTWRDSGTLCRRALAVTERNYVAHEHLGLFLQRQGDLAGAEREYQAVLAITTALPSTYINLGAIHAGLGRRAEARAAFETALERDPDFLKARLSLGYFLETTGDLAGAREQYARAAREHPDQVGPWERLAIVCQGLGRTEEARAAEERARALGR
ncbi:MAG TPA: tetratricopeptide repeat protein [Planctomycetota bacterium]